jgi:hypothetical protein
VDDQEKVIDSSICYYPKESAGNLALRMKTAQEIALRIVLFVSPALKGWELAAKMKGLGL